MESTNSTKKPALSDYIMLNAENSHVVWVEDAIFGHSNQGLVMRPLGLRYSKSIPGSLFTFKNPEFSPGWILLYYHTRHLSLTGFILVPFEQL